MDIEGIKRFSDDILQAMTERDKSGRGWVCPVCGSGSGKHGTGLTQVKGKPGYYHCFAAGCEFEHGDILELIGKTYRLQDTAAQIEKAGQLIGRDFTNKNEWDTKPNKREQSAMNDKKTLQTNDNKVSKQEAQRIKEFITEARAALPASDVAKAYITRRGISIETAKAAGLGYCSSYGDGMNTAAVIIPTGPDSYTARSMNTNDSARKIRKKKAGERQGIFGIDVLQSAAPYVFICEGEFDVLSVREIGLPAIATGGGTSKRELVEAIKQSGKLPGVFIILPDNDRREDGSIAQEKGPKAARDLKKEMDAEGIPAIIADVTKGGTWPKEAKDCNDFLVLDRDGFREALQQIADTVTEKALGILPCGSGDGLALHLGISRNPRKALATLQDGVCQTMDCGEVDGRPFFCTTGVGLDAQVAWEFATAGKRGLWTYISLAWKIWQHFKPETYTLEIDGQTYRFPAVFVTVGNANQWGNQARITSLASVQDGLLEVTVVLPFHTWEIPVLATKLLDGRAHTSRRTRMFRGRQVVIHREKEGPAHYDGDPCRKGTEIHVNIVPSALHVMVPENRNI